LLQRPGLLSVTPRP